MSSSKEEKQEKKIVKNPKISINNNIITNNSLKDEIQEILADQAIIQKKLIEQNNDNDNYILELIFPEEITQKNFKIKFLLVINNEYPNKEPELYCITVFSHPHICDGRNLINDIINGEWVNKKLPLENIINKIPKFIVRFNEIINDDNTCIVGKYIINKYYKINFIKELPIYFNSISNNSKIITISDISLCIYDLDKKNIKYYKLYLYLNIKDIIEASYKQKKILLPLNTKIH